MRNYMVTITRVLLTGSGDLRHCGRSLVGESQVAEWRGANGWHELQRTFTECSRHVVRSDTSTPNNGR